ncbi:2'3'-cyclic-nucleotide 2'-phosphodiesterase [Marinomonas sp. MED121]|uniref:bifunctional metallophosphatase/5'-nucleotidase n=1 Tax=Marinomonas sp. MED121 TaxID=314277 RepID=UPI000068FB5C|nr:5'-nucleotidase C-terminal domain-containing protein [Marinomonas sp. MED121]EAQ64980.1 2'3'-cyclic-nucleotide 2'-phosphodiesterase [Marinomonas sp. MED121]
MKKRVILTASLILSSVFLPLKSLAATLVFSSNLPDILISADQPNLSRLSGFVNQLKKEHKDSVLFIHGGDSLFPNALSNYDSGAHMIDVLNHMHVDLFAVNQREFANGVDQLTLRSNEASFPMVLSNFKDSRTHELVEGLLPSYQLMVEGINFGFIVILDESINRTYLQGEVEVEGVALSVQKLAKELRETGSDKVILITESDVLESEPNESFNSLDLILVAKEGADRLDASVTPIRVYSGGHDGDLALVEFKDINSEPEVRIASYRESQESVQVSQTLQRYLDRLNIILEYELGVLVKPLSSIRSHIRTQEAAIGNLFADSMREYTSADLAIINSGSIRGYQEYSVGQTVKRADINRELPFGDHIFTIKVNKDEILAMMENSLSQVEDLSGRFLQISGFKVSYDLSRDPFDRVLEISVDDRPLENRDYSLVLSGYLLKGGDEYQVFKDKSESYTLKETRLLWTIVSDYIEKRKGVDIVTDGRLEDLTP